MHRASINGKYITISRPLEDDRDTAVSNIHKNWRKLGVVPEICSRTDMLVTILCFRIGGGVINKHNQ